MSIFDLYDREGKPISMTQWGELLADSAYKIVAQDTVGAYLVSTVWLGMNHNYNPDTPPLIFETMVFLEGDFDDIEMERYTTEEEAVAGHKAMRDRWELFSMADLVLPKGENGDDAG